MSKSRNKRISHACAHAQPIIPGGGSIRDFGGSQNIHWVGVGSPRIRAAVSTSTVPQLTENKKSFFRFSSSASRLFGRKPTLARRVWE